MAAFPPLLCCGKPAHEGEEPRECPAGRAKTVSRILGTQGLSEELMDSREGRLAELQPDASAVESECGQTREADSIPGRGMDNRAIRVISKESSGFGQFFWTSDDDEMESAPRDLHQKWKRILQKRNYTATGVNEADAEFGASKWQDLPMELLVRILGLVDHRTVVFACGVCTGWREAMRTGILELSFSWCGRSVSKLVQSLAPKFTRLEVCNLRRCPSLTDQAVEAIAHNCNDLRILDLSNGTRITNASLFALASGCVKLDRLDLSGCVGVTELGIVALAERCNNLRQLNLCGCDNAGSDTALQALAQNCAGLQCLNVGWCEKITDEGVTALALWCCDLRVVDLCGCLKITDRSVIVLADKCHRLRALGLHCCRNITDTAMYALVNNSKLRTGRGNSKRFVGYRQYRGDVGSRSAVTKSSTGSCSSNSSSSSSSGSSCSSSSDSSTTTIPGRGSFDSLLNDPDGYGLVSLNLSGCVALSALAVQAVCDAFPALHTCPERCSLNISGCLNLTSVHCICVVEARRERVNRAACVRPQVFNPRNRPL